MNRIEIPNTPGNASNYELDDGRVLRVHLKLLTPESDLSTAEFVQVETTAYPIDKQGNFILDNGEPIMLRPIKGQIPLKNVREGTDSIKPGWVKRDLAYDPENPREDVSDVEEVSGPVDGVPGKRVYIQGEAPFVRVYVAGLYEQAKMVRVGEYASMAPASSPEPLSGTQVEALKP